MYRSFARGLVTGIIILNSLTACKHASPENSKPGHSVIPVTVSAVRNGSMVIYDEFIATSEYLTKAAIKAPVTGYIDKMTVSQGDAVEKGRILYKIKTKEATALAGDSLDNLKFTGIVDVKAVITGTVTAIGQSAGDYVSEGDLLCQIAVTASFAFILDVPFELSGIVRLNSPCDITLPDSQIVKGIIRSRLPSMTANSQTERFIVRLSSPESLPENLSGKIKIARESVRNAASVPKSSILTDETMHSFWVMKMVNDSMAIKVPVTTGITAGEYVQIIKPVFSPADQFLSSGNYGLGDTVYVKVLKNTGDGK